MRDASAAPTSTGTTAATSVFGRAANIQLENLLTLNLCYYGRPPAVLFVRDRRAVARLQGRATLEELERILEAC